MRNSQYRTASIFILIAFVGFSLSTLSCTEETTVVQPIDGDVAHLTGKLLAQVCENVYPFYQQAGEPAKITLVKDNGFSSRFEIDSSSSFERYVGAGTYLAIIESGFTWPPDTIYNLHFSPGDTTVEFRVYLDVLDADHVFFTFWYDSGQTRLPAAEEVALMRQAGQEAADFGRQGPLYLLPLWPVDTFLIRTFCLNGECTYTYAIPIERPSKQTRTGWNAIEAWMAIQQVLAENTNGLYPSRMYVWAGHYICHFGAGEQDGDRLSNQFSLVYEETAVARYSDLQRTDRERLPGSLSFRAPASTKE